MVSIIAQSNFHWTYYLKNLLPITYYPINLLPEEYKFAENVENFKNKIKLWIPENCPCRLCKDYVTGIGFL